MSGVNTTASFGVIVNLATPVNGSPATLRSLLSATQLARIGSAIPVQAQIWALTNNAQIRDDANTARTNDYLTLLAAGSSQTITSDNVLDSVYVESATTAGVIKVLLSCCGFKS